MALEDLIGQLYNTNSQLPLAYGGMYANAYNPYFQYMGNQAGNMAGMGNTYMGQMGQMGQQGMQLYGQLAGQQASMYGAELPFQMEQQKWNALAPVLGGLLGQGGMTGLPQIGQVSMGFNRPDVMAGYQGAVDRGYKEMKGAYGDSVGNARSYDSQFGGAFADMMDKMPAAPYARSTEPSGRGTIKNWQPPADQNTPYAPPGGVRAAGGPVQRYRFAGRW